MRCPNGHTYSSDDSTTGFDCPGCRDDFTGTGRMPDPWNEVQDDPERHRTADDHRRSVSRNRYRTPTE